MNLPKLNGAVWASVVVNYQEDVDRVAALLDDIGVKFEQHDDGVFVDSDNGGLTLQFRVDK